MSTEPSGPGDDRVDEQLQEAGAADEGLRLLADLPAARR
jgi:hypothetical protein